MRTALLRAWLHPTLCCHAVELPWPDAASMHGSQHFVLLVWLEPAQLLVSVQAECAAQLLSSLGV